MIKPTNGDSKNGYQNTLPKKKRNKSYTQRDTIQQLIFSAFLDFPRILDKGIKKLIELKEKFGGMLSNMGGMMGQGGPNPEELQKKMFESLDGMKTKVEEINKQFKDPEKTTFVAVCIPEFLSMYETERLAIELAK